MEQVVAATAASGVAVGSAPRAVPAGFATLLAQRVAAPGAVTGPDVAAGADAFAAAAAAPSATLGEMLRAPLPGTSVPAALAPAPLGVPVATGPAALVGDVAPTGGATLVRPVAGRLSSDFGMRVHPVTGQYKMHSGVDFAAPTGTPIGAAAGGTVSFAGVRGGYGNLVIVDHPNGTQTYYAHADTLGVRAGQQVSAGSVLGTVGSTGLATGPHLHFELRRNGEPVDPAPELGR